MAGRVRKQNRVGFTLWKRIAVYGLLLLILSTLQCSFFARLRFLPATPDLILCALLAILLLDSTPSAAIAAVGGGFLLDAIGGVGVTWSPLFYLVVISVMGILSSKMLRGFLAWLVLLLPSILMRLGFTAIGMVVGMGGFSMASALRSVLLPEAIVTLLLGIPVYFLVKLCMPLLASPNHRPRL